MTERRTGSRFATMTRSCLPACRSGLPSAVSAWTGGSAVAADVALWVVTMAGTSY
jgi:hypothetical protein